MVKPSTKTPSDSFVSQSSLVLPNDTNMLNNLMGGRLMYQMDIVAAIAAQKHSNSSVVTACVDNVSFNHSISLGSVVTINAWVTRSFNTSMEVKVEVKAENIPDKITEFKSNEAFFTFVAVDGQMNPVNCPKIEPTSKNDYKLFEDALKRRQFRLLVAKKINPEDAPELRSLLNF